MFKRIKNILKKEKISYSLPYGWGSSVWGSIVTKTDTLSFYKSWVYGCIQVRANGIAKTEFTLYQSRGKNVVEVLENPLLDLLNQVNPDMTKYDFLELLVIYLDLYGSCPIVLFREGRLPTQMYPIRPDKFKVIKNKDGSISHYEYVNGSQTQKFLPEDVIILKRPNPANPDLGLGVIESVRITAQNDDYQKQYNQKLLLNGSRPDGVIEADDGLSDNAYKRLKKYFKEKYSGYDNAYKTMILEGGLKWKSISIPPKDMEFLKAREANREELMAMFGVPKIMLGLDSGYNRATAETAERTFAKWVLEPMLDKILAQLNEFLVPMFGTNLLLAYEPLAGEDTEVQLKKYDSGYNKWLTTNEIRRMEGLDELQGGDFIYRPLSEVPAIGGTNNTKSFIKMELKNAGQMPILQQIKILKKINARDYKLNIKAKKVTDKIMEKIEGKTKIVIKLSQKKKHKCNCEIKADDELSSIHKVRFQEEVALQGLWKKTLRAYFEGQEKRFQEALADNKKSIDEEIGISFDNEFESLSEVMSATYYETFMKGSQQAISVVGNVSLDMEYIKGWIADSSEEWAKEITQTTIDQFNDAVKLGIAEGEGIAGLSARTSEVFDLAKGYRTERIARTEVARTTVESHRTVYKDGGFKDVEWLLVDDASTGSLDREYSERDDWTVDSIKGVIPVHPNCRCDFVPKF